MEGQRQLGRSHRDPTKIRRLVFAALQVRVGERAGSQCVDLRFRLDAFMGHSLLNRFQTCFDALHLSSMLCSAFSRLLGDQSTDFLFVLEPPPEPDPNHCEERNPKDRFDQQRFLEGENVDDAVAHISLLTCTSCRQHSTANGTFMENVDDASFAYTSW